ncbi:MAG: hypothetical protein QXU82_02080 [Candidatus Aenigmatarchaeota archaeon]
MRRIMSGRLKQFDIEIEDRVGSLADLCEILSLNAINIRAITTNGNGTVKIVTGDEVTTRNALSKAKLLFAENDIMALKLLDRPGELAKITRVLANQKINIRSVYLLGKDPVRKETEVALQVSDIGAAAKVLSQLS